MICCVATVLIDHDQGSREELSRWIAGLRLQSPCSPQLRLWRDSVRPQAVPFPPPPPSCLPSLPSITPDCIWQMGLLASYHQVSGRPPKSISLCADRTSAQHFWMDGAVAWARPGPGQESFISSGRASPRPGVGWPRFLLSAPIMRKKQGLAEVVELFSCCNCCKRSCNQHSGTVKKLYLDLKKKPKNSLPVWVWQLLLSFNNWRAAQVSGFSPICRPVTD